MAYGDSVDPKSRVVSIVMVGVITFLLGWLLVSGLAIDVAKKAIQKLDVVDIQEPPPPEEPPPPLPELELGGVAAEAMELDRLFPRSEANPENF